MLTILEYAKLSAHVYQPEAKLMGYVGPDQTTINKKDIDRVRKNLVSERWFRVIDVDPRMQTHNAFYAQLYIKIDRQVPRYAVVAYRGSDNVPNYIVDAVSWTSHVLGEGAHVIAPPVYTSEAKAYFDACCDYVKHYFPSIRISDISVTGHSLGGALAQLMVARYLLPHAAVTFNPPGIGEIMQVSEAAARRIFSVNSLYGFINKAGVQVGHVYQIHVQEKEAEAKALFEKFNHQLYAASFVSYRLGDSNLAYAPFLYSAGLVSRLAAYLTAEPALVNAPETKQIEHQCMASHLENWRETRALYRLKCHAQSVATEFAKVVLAQHGINNIITALLQKENYPISMKAI